MKKLIWCILLMCGVAYATVHREDGVWELSDQEVIILNHQIDVMGATISNLKWQNAELNTRIYECEHKLKKEI